MSELKSCPFCGGDVDMLRAEVDEVGKVLYMPRCRECRAAILMKGQGEYTAYESAEAAAAAWNTRHVETCTIGDYKDPDYGYTHDAMWNDEWFVPSGRCSGCGEYIPVWNYCPKCGRKVEGK